MKMNYKNIHKIISIASVISMVWYVVFASFHHHSHTQSDNQCSCDFHGNENAELCNINDNSFESINSVLNIPTDENCILCDLIQNNIFISILLNGNHKSFENNQFDYIKINYKILSSLLILDSSRSPPYLI